MAEKPRLRGHFHQAAFFFAFGACSVLLTHASSTQALVAGSIYSICLITMFGVSAFYHRRNWGQQGRLVMKRLDHAAIYIFIAASGTPIALLAMPPDSGRRMLLTMWIAAALGACKSLLWVRSPKWLSAILYVFIGWICVSFAGEFRAALGDRFWLLVAGGIVYSVGAVGYATKRPNPWPGLLGYHEVFHCAVIIGAVLHFCVIQALIV